jgi:hypothetical protein
MYPRGRFDGYTSKRTSRVRCSVGQCVPVQNCGLSNSFRVRPGQRGWGGARPAIHDPPTITTDEHTIPAAVDHFGTADNRAHAAEHVISQ